MQYKAKLLMGFVGLSMGYFSTVETSFSMEAYKFHAILQKNGLVANQQIQDLTIQQADEYSEYLARMYQQKKERKALSSLRIIYGMRKFESLRTKIQRQLQEMSYLKPPAQTGTPAKKPTATATKGTQKKTLTLDYFYGILRANKLLPNDQIQYLNNDELKTYIDYLLLKRKYDSTNQAVIDALKVILKLPQYKQFIGTKEEIFLYAKQKPTVGNGVSSLTDSVFYGFMKKGEVMSLDIVKQLNREQLDIYIDYIRLRYKYYRIEDGDQMDNPRTVSAEQYLHTILLIRAEKKSLY